MSIKVTEVLKEMKKSLLNPKQKLDILLRKKSEDPLDPYTTQNTMLDLEFDVEDIREQLLLLDEDNYIETVDDNKSSQTIPFHIFGKKIQNKEIYIKFKIRQNDDIFCISFHYARYPLANIIHN